MLDLRNTLTTTSALFSQKGIAHALIGGFALAVHGIHRATSDVDFLADGNRREDILKVMNQNGFVLKYSSTEVLQFAGVGFVDILLANRPLSKQMLQRATLEKTLSVNVLNVEDIVGLKIQAFSNDAGRELQDKADIQSLFIKHPNLDWSRVKEFAELFGQWHEIEKLRNKK
jgi:hypothetical protein